MEENVTKLAIGGLVAGGIALGHQLGLFKTLASNSTEENPADASRVAKASKCKERYVKEWLCVMATGDIIEVNDNEEFWIKPENIQALTVENSGLLYATYIPCFLKGHQKLADAFRQDGPYGLEYADYNDFYDVMNRESEMMHKEGLIKTLLGQVDPELQKRLEDGDMMVLDVGCGTGLHASVLAENFPNSNFTGIDITLDAVLRANQKKKDDGKTFDNLAFIQMDGGKMDEDWTDKYDVVFIFDACHDQMRPDKCLSEIHRVLKPGGTFAMLEIKGSSDVLTDKKEHGLTATALYATSMYHCLPVGSNSEDTLCLGAMWGNKRAIKMLQEAGFVEVRQEDTPQFEINQLYVAKKA